MIKPESYFTIRDLWDIENLKKECERNFVRIATSPYSPSVVMLHYTQEAQTEKQWNTFNRMCRGLIVDLANHKILAYPFDKFFNLDEMPETAYSVLEELGSFEITEKLDGSMLTLYKEPTTGEYRLTTKGSMASDHGVLATSMIPESMKQALASDDTLLQNMTLIFELISYKFQIVINYKTKGYPEGLYLIGARHRYSNKLMNAQVIRGLAQQLGVYTAKSYEFASLDELLKNVKTLTVLEEGYVLKFHDRMVKVKGSAYLAAHRFISKLSRKSILEALGNGSWKELASMAPEEYKDEVLKEIEYFTSQRLTLERECYEWFSKAPKESRKDFALWVQKNVPSDLKGFLFHILDHRSFDDRKVYEVIGTREGVSGETRI